MTPAAKVRRFSFDTEFDASGAIVRQGARTKSYSIEEVEAERAQAYAKGRDDDVARANAQIAQAVSSLAQAAQSLTREVALERRQMLKDAAALALAIAQKISGRALDAWGLERVSGALDEAFDSIVGAPRVIVRVAPALESARAQLEETARHGGFEGALVVRADPSIRFGDVTFDWGDGAVVHDSAEALRRIEEHTVQSLAALTETGAPQ